MPAFNVHRLRTVFLILVVLLVLDLGYLYHLYAKPEQKVTLIRAPPEVKKKSLIWPKDKSFITSEQADHILDPTALQRVQEAMPQSVKSNVVLLKTHKTGSSTLQNIILRYAILHRLKVALPVYQASFLWPYSFHSSFVLKQINVTKHNVLVHHSVWNKKEIDSIMDDEPYRVTILRNPIDLFLSAYKYYNFGLYCFEKPIEEFMESPNIDALHQSLCPALKMPTRNMQAFDFGLTFNQMGSPSRIASLIKEIEANFNLVMIMERFDESLLLMAKTIGWSLQDVVYFKQNAQGKRFAQSQWPQSTQDYLVQQIQRFNDADDILYDYFSKRFDERLKEHFTDQQLRENLETLRQLQQSYTDKCVHKLADFRSFTSTHLAMFRPYGPQTLGYLLKTESSNDIMCRILAMPELSLTYFLKGKAQYIQPDLNQIVANLHNRSRPHI